MTNLERVHKAHKGFYVCVEKKGGGGARKQQKRKIKFKKSEAKAEGWVAEDF